LLHIYIIIIEDCQSIVFVNDDKETQNRVATQLKLTYYLASNVHSREESQQDNILNSSKNKDVKILVVTDDYSIPFHITDDYLINKFHVSYWINNDFFLLLFIYNSSIIYICLYIFIYYYYYFTKSKIKIIFKI